MDEKIALLLAEAITPKLLEILAHYAAEASISTVRCYTIDQTAELMNTSRDRISGWIHCGKLEAFLINPPNGKDYRIYEDDIKTLIGRLKNESMQKVRMPGAIT